MKNIGVVSCNIYCNFTNYGSALQSWALSQVINKLENGKYEAKLVDYCPDIMLDKDPLNPMKNMWDKDEQSRKMCELSMPAIRENYKKFDSFYNNQFKKSRKKYTSKNFNEIVQDENIDGFVCGSDTIFCINEFGFDDAYYANFDCMKNGQTISYAASFGDSKFNDDTYKILNERLQNFKALGIREKGMIPYLKEHTSVEVKRVLDPTLLLDQSDYDKIAYPNRLEKDKYLLLYARRKNDKMTAYADRIAKENGWKVIEISLQAINADRHRMFYEAGVEEFLSLVKNAEYVVTNSFHGMLFSIQYRKPFITFCRDQSNTKIMEVMDMLKLTKRIGIEGNEILKKDINYNEVFDIIKKERKESLKFLENNLQQFN